ncbi:hypothetical protein IKE67_03255 [bacterium]|nr:hypothetical protein [bacterium]
MIDFGREVYFPELMLKGNLLYKDLFNIFGPLGYQINAWLFSLFGAKQTTLAIAGNFCSILILYSVYFISRIFQGAKISFFTTLFVLVACVFSPSVFNFIYPYSYSLLYSYTAFMCSVLFFLIGFKLKDYKFFDFYIMLSFFMIGISLAAKFEYLPFAFLMVLYCIFVFKQNILKFLLNFLSMLFVPIISYSSLLYQGVDISDLIKNFNYMKLFVHSDGFYYFYSHIVGTLPSLDLLNKFIPFDFVVTIGFIILCTIVYFSVVMSTDKPKIFKPEYFIIAVCLILPVWKSVLQIFLLIPYFIYVIFIYELVFKIKNKKFNFAEDIFFVLLCISMISMIKTAFILDMNIYGPYTVTLPLIAIISFITTNVPKTKLNILKVDVENLLATFLMIFVISVGYTSYNNLSEKTSLISNDKVEVFMRPVIAKSVRELLSYIDKNIGADESLLFIPDGAFINFMTDIDMKLYNYQSLIPPYVEVFGIDKIIADIKKEKIDNIVLSSRSSVEYNGGKYICKPLNSKMQDDYTQRKEEKMLCDYIRSNYNIAEIINKGYIFEIYKRK